VFRRDPRNPILTPLDLGFEANSVFNPGAVRLRDGRVALLLRVEDRRGQSAVHVAREVEPNGRFEVDERPLLQPRAGDPAAAWGFEDARVSYLAELDRYVITCTAFGARGPCVYLAVSHDLTDIEDGRVVQPPEDKNSAVLPRRVGGAWLLLHRPVVMLSRSADVWISRSDDLYSWREPQPVLLTREGGFWDSSRVGIGPPPIETPEGWLLMYHGVRATVAGAIYRVGAALLDLDEPWRVTARLDDWVLAPSDPWERTGDVGNVVFPCGAVVDDAEGTVDLYYGAADTVVCRASARLDDLLAALRCL
jgi:predicted GH43/DUF377 family glycosyl hydrolase